MSVTTIQIKPVETYPVRIEISCPLAKGYFTGHAKVRTKAQFEELRQAVQDGEYEGRDADLLREMYERFDGFGDDDGWKDVLEGPASAYLSLAAVSAYFEHFAEARRGNSRQRRGR